MRAEKNQNGYTLLELLVVLAILALLATLATPRVLQFMSKAKADIARVQLDNVAAALDLYRLEVGAYPPNLDALVRVPDAGTAWNGPYLEKADGLQDPWGRAYRYQMPGEGRDYDLSSLGADGEPGGTGDNADIVR